MKEKWIDCMGPNLPTVLFYLCDVAQEFLSEKDPDYKKVDADKLVDAIVDHLEDSAYDKTLSIGKILGIELNIVFDRETPFVDYLKYARKVDVTCYDTRYGDGAGDAAVRKAREAKIRRTGSIRRLPTTRPTGSASARRAAIRCGRSSRPPRSGRSPAPPPPSPRGRRLPCRMSITRSFASVCWRTVRSSASLERTVGWSR